MNLPLEIPPEILDISPDEKAKDINGCGPKPINDRKSFFEPACEIHDIEYSPPFAGSSKHRRDTDKRFLHNMLELVQELPWHQKLLRKAQAYFFYGCVRVFGTFFYNKK